MIPIYNCREDYLRETLRSVLGQDPGVADMQIEVIDNDSTIGDPEAVIREMGSERIEYHRQPINVGIIENFNACINRARGQWVHILHGDDTVRSDFYSRARSGIAAHPEVGAALCRTIYMPVDGPGRARGPHSRRPGRQLRRAAARGPAHPVRCYRGSPDDL
jgi:glycosyltransferase involved in cell wall biosynthesis